MTNLTILGPEDDWPDYLPVVDVYFQEAYIKSTAIIENARPQIAVLKEHDKYVIYPYCIRNIAGENSLFDIVTPYGYGGPITNEAILIPAFRTQFDAFCRQNGIVTETIRFHPLLKNEMGMDEFMTVDFIRHTAGINLENGPDSIWHTYKPNVRNRIRQAQKAGIEVISRKDVNSIKAFYILYLSTMERVKAPAWYFFPFEYFIHLLQMPSSELYMAIQKDKIISGAIILESENYGHYHLSGSDVNYQQFHPNHLLIHTVAAELQKKGKKIFHLGGGFNANDSLFDFKKSFCGNSIFSFYLGKKIHLTKEYEHLNRKAAFHKTLNPNFFPLYRS